MLIATGTLRLDMGLLHHHLEALGLWLRPRLRLLSSDRALNRDGVARQADPGDATGDNLIALRLHESAGRGISALPPTLLHACDDLVADDVLRSGFGTGRDGDYVDYFASVKRTEFRTITDRVTAAELDAYLTLV